MKEIPLTQGKTALVDDDLYAWLSQWRWHAQKGRRTFYAARGVKQGTGQRRLVFMHREIMGTPKGMEVDHKDHDGLHNWRGNLRVCTHQENGANQQLRRDSNSRYKGVHHHRFRWQARIEYNNRNRCLGTFDTRKEAAMAYNVVASELFGEFAHLNEI